MSGSINLRDASAVSALFGRAADLMRASPLRRGSAVRLPMLVGGRLLATGDLHDNPDHLRKIIRLARLEQSPHHHVVLHEMIHGEKLINGLDLSHRMLARVAELVAQFPQQVHPVLANHELSQLTGKGVSKGAGNNVDLFNDGLDFVFGEESGIVQEAIAQFIRAMPLAVVSESGVLCAHSLPAASRMKDFDAAILDRELTEADYVRPMGRAHLMVWGRELTPPHVAELARAWNVRLFCLGHEHVESGFAVRFTGPPTVIVLNSDHERAMVLPIDLSRDPPTAEQAMMAAVPLAAISAGE